MPHKDRDAYNAYMRARHARLKEEDPVWAAKQAARAAENHRKRQADDEAYRSKRQEDHKRWYENGGKEWCRDSNGSLPLEEYLVQCEVKRKSKSAYMTEWNKTEKGQRNRVAQSIKKRCLITIDEYDAAYDKQNGNCIICGMHYERYGKPRLAVDHCHIKGHFRGLLCNNCNSAIGLLEESEERLLNAIAYLRS